MKKESFKRSVVNLVKANIWFHNINKRAEQVLGLSLVQFYVLSIILEMPARSPQVLAQKLGMHPSTLTQMIKRLLKKEFIFVDIDVRDSRKKVLGITTEGRQVITEFERQQHNFFRDLDADV